MTSCMCAIHRYVQCKCLLYKSCRYLVICTYVHTYFFIIACHHWKSKKLVSQVPLRHLCLIDTKGKA